MASPAMIPAAAVAWPAMNASISGVRPVLQEWFTSPDGKAVLNAESGSASTHEQLEKLKRDGIVLLESMSKSRRSALDAVLAASRSAEITTTITIGSVLAVVRALHRSNPEIPLPSENELCGQLEAGRSRMERAFYPGFLEMYASVYQSLSDARLQRYADLLASPAGSHLVDVLGKAIEATMVDGAERLWREMLPKNDGATV